LNFFEFQNTNTALLREDAFKTNCFQINAEEPSMKPLKTIHFLFEFQNVNIALLRQDAFRGKCFQTNAR
jgi:hypothetical protein